MSPSRQDCSGIASARSQLAGSGRWGKQEGDSPGAFLYLCCVCSLNNSALAELGGSGRVLLEVNLESWNGLGCGGPQGSTYFSVS